jgi:hypothetical protein
MPFCVRGRATEAGGPPQAEMLDKHLPSSGWPSMADVARDNGDWAAESAIGAGARHVEPHAAAERRPGPTGGGCDVRDNGDRFGRPLGPNAGWGSPAAAEGHDGKQTRQASRPTEATTASKPDKRPDQQRPRRQANPTSVQAGRGHDGKKAHTRLDRRSRRLRVGPWSRRLDHAGQGPERQARSGRWPL